MASGCRFYGTIHAMKKELNREDPRLIVVLQLKAFHPSMNNKVPVYFSPAKISLTKGFKCKDKVIVEYTSQYFPKGNQVYFYATKIMFNLSHPKYNPDSNYEFEKKKKDLSKGIVLVSKIDKEKFIKAGWTKESLVDAGYAALENKNKNGKKIK
jgi:hypothetical protein